MRAGCVQTLKNKLGKLRWSLLFAGVLVASLMAFLPGNVQAATEGWPRFWKDRSALPGFWLGGEVVSVEEGSVTLQLPNPHNRHGMMRFVTLNVTLDVVSDTVMLDGDLAPLDLSTLAEGDSVVVVPRLAWGNLVAQLLYAGDPEDLADATYRGKLVEQEGDTLVLENGRDGEFTVLVDDATVWYENGRMERPTELAEDVALRVLGVEEENAEGEDVVRAVLITPAR